MNRRHAPPLFAALCLLTEPTYAIEPPQKYAIVIHGGAGKAPASEEWRRERETALDFALETGAKMLRSGESSLDTVETVVRILEDSPVFNAGKGAVFNAAGAHELDATIMDGRDRSVGAVGGVSTVKNPVSLARRVMTDNKSATETQATQHYFSLKAALATFADGHYFDPDEPALAATVASLNDTTLVYRPDARTKYSNAAVSVVGAVLESKLEVSHPQ